MKTLAEAFHHTLKDIYFAENALVKALPNVAKAAGSAELKSAVEDHLAETKEQVKLLKQVFESIGEKAEGERCDAIEGLIKENLLLPLNQAALPNLQHLAPEFRNLPFDPGNVFSVPFRADIIGIVVNSERVKKKIAGYEDVFSGANKGRIVVLDEPREITSWAFAVLDLPVNEVTDAHLDKAKPLLAKWLRQIKAYDSDHPESLLQNNEVDIGILRSDSAAALMQADSHFQWVLPKEGSHLAVDSFCIPRTATQVEAALAFINFLLRPDISAEISRTIARINPNLAARELLASEPSAAPIAFPRAEEFSRLKTFRDIGNQSLRVEEIINGLKAP